MILFNCDEQVQTTYMPLFSITVIFTCSVDV